MKTTKGGKVMNPTDAYRKELRKKELKRVITSKFHAFFPFNFNISCSIPCSDLRFRFGFDLFN